MTGYVQIYTGDGKGKTTAALGLIVRAHGAGLGIYLGQFLKKGEFSELRTLHKFVPGVTIEQFGTGKFIKGKPSRKDIEAAQAGIAAIVEAMRDGRYDVVVADEINTAVSCGVLTVGQVLEMLDKRPSGVELVLTGRNAHDDVMARADLITRMDAVKHYFDSGVKARPGIER